MLPSDAAMPPCAAPVCERVGYSLLMTAVLAPREAYRPAISPAPPAAHHDHIELMNFGMNSSWNDCISGSALIAASRSPEHVHADDAHAQQEDDAENAHDLPPARSRRCSRRRSPPGRARRAPRPPAAAALAATFQNDVAHGSRSGTLVLCTCVTLGMKAQRITSAKFIWVRAPMISAPIRPNRIKPYIASAESRVKSHISISKLSPRCERDRVRDFAAMPSLPSPPRTITRTAKPYTGRKTIHSSQMASRSCTSSDGHRSRMVMRRPLMAWNSTQKKMKIWKIQLS